VFSNEKDDKRLDGIHFFTIYSQLCFNNAHLAVHLIIVTRNINLYVQKGEISYNHWNICRTVRNCLKRMLITTTSLRINSKVVVLLDPFKSSVRRWNSINMNFWFTFTFSKCCIIFLPLVNSLNISFLPGTSSVKYFSSIISNWSSCSYGDFFSKPNLCSPIYSNVTNK
jgi:hypothetical protein